MMDPRAQQMQIQLPQAEPEPEPEAVPDLYDDFYDADFEFPVQVKKEEEEEEDFTEMTPDDLNTLIPSAELSQAQRSIQFQDAVERIKNLGSVFLSQETALQVAQTENIIHASPDSLTAVKSGWMLVLTRLLTRSSSNKSVENRKSQAIAKEVLLAYILEDFRTR